MINSRSHTGWFRYNYLYFLMKTLQNLIIMFQTETELQELIREVEENPAPPDAPQPPEPKPTGKGEGNGK